MFVPTAEVDRITLGSYERLIDDLAEAVAKEAPRLFEGAKRTKIVATFEGVVVVGSDLGTFVRVGFSRNPSGKIKLEAVTPLSVAVVDAAKMPAFLKKEAIRAVDAFLEGRVTEAVGIAAGISPFLTEAPRSEEHALRLALAEVEGTRPWVKVLQDRTGPILSTLGEDKAAPAPPLFEALYAPGADSRSADKFRELVAQKMGSLVQRAQAAYGRVVESHEQLTRQTQKPDEPAVASFLNFVEDLLVDGRVLKHGLLTCETRLGQVVSLARLHDAAAPRLAQFELASRFVAGMTSRLATGK